MNKKTFENNKLIYLFLASCCVIIIMLIMLYFSRGEQVSVYQASSVSADFIIHSDVSEPQPGTIKVQIAGEIVNPKVYEIDEGSRVEDLIALAGGPTEFADLSEVNEAVILKDEQKIYIPSVTESTDGDIPPVSSPKRNDGLIDINTASSVELVLLPGIGEVKANDIINYREKNGPFKIIDEIKNVYNIGDATFERIRDQITVK